MNTLQARTGVEAEAEAEAEATAEPALPATASAHRLVAP